MKKESTKNWRELTFSAPLRATSSGTVNRMGQFVMTHWVEKVGKEGESKERFRYFPEDSLVRKECEELLDKHYLDYSEIRFQENLAYVLLREKQPSTPCNQLNVISID